MPIYGFDEESAKRIGETVRLVEGSRTGTRGAGGPKTGRAAVGVRCMVGTIGTAAWASDSTASVTIYSGDPGSESSAGTVVARNYFSGISTSASTARWVAISNNGFGWVLVNSESAAGVESTTVSVLTGVSLTTAGLSFTSSTIEVLSTSATSISSISVYNCQTDSVTPEGQSFFLG